MNTNLHLVFNGKCDAAFTLYEKVFGLQRVMTMKYSDAPAADESGAPGGQVPDDAADLIMHTAMRLGTLTLMGADAPPNRPALPPGGFQISVDMPDEAEVHRIFAELSEGGTVMMAPQATFWTPLFSMLTDKFGIGWMISVPGPEMS